MKKQIVLSLGVLVFMGGCTLSPEYKKPPAPIPAEWPQESVGNISQDMTEAAAVHELSRQEFFLDENMQKIIKMALDNNRDLRLAALNVEKARALFDIQQAELFPAVNAVGAGSKQRLSSDLVSPGDPRTVEQYSVGLGIASWEIDFFGRIRSLKEQALEQFLATDEARRGAQIALVSEAARTYLTLAADLENLKLAQSTLETQQEIYTLIQRQYEAGIANELDLRRTQTQIETARGDVARFTQMTALDRNALNLLTGSQVPKDLLPADLTSVHPPREIFASLSSEALLNRPDIIAAEHRLKGAYAFIGAARSAFFPRISLTTSVGTASDELSGLFGSGTGTWNFAPQITVPIFDARTWAAYRVSKTEREIALAQYEKTIQTAFREVADTLAIQGMIDQQVFAQQSLTNAVEDTFSLSNKRYSKGIDNYLGVLDAQRSLYSAQQGLISLRLTKLANQVRLYAVLGGGSEK
jgi:outer membrane protein, multidrug efflux system